jgi:hypothetical protein
MRARPAEIWLRSRSSICLPTWYMPRAFNALFVLGIHHVQSRMRTLHLRTTKGFLIETISPPFNNFARIVKNFTPSGKFYLYIRGLKKRSEWWNWTPKLAVCSQGGKSLKTSIISLQIHAGSLAFFLTPRPYFSGGTECGKQQLKCGGDINIWHHK